MMNKQHPTAAQKPCRGFTLAELIVSLGILVLLILMVAQVFNTAATTVRPANKHIDTDTQARTVLDRMAVDIAKMLKRTDIDYYIKAPVGYKNPKEHGKGLKLNKGQLGNDQVAFFSEVPGYYPAGSQSPLSLVAYRINENQSPNNPKFLQLERMGKGLLWNGVDNGTSGTSPYPIVFATGQIVPNCVNNKCPCTGTTGPWAGPWSGAFCNDDKAASVDPDYETIGPGVFRFEYYYLLKDGTVTDSPRLTGAPVNWSPSDPNPLSWKLNAFCDVEAIAVVIAVIDPASRALAGTDALFNLMSDLPDFATAHGNGYGNQKKTLSSLESTWNGTLFGDSTLGLQGIVNTGQTSDGSPFPPEAAKGVRIYYRYFDIRTLADL